MTSASTFPQRLTKIDDLARRDHYYLTDVDACFYIGEYTARKGYSYSETNQLIINFKKPMERRSRPEWHYKEQAIRDAASAFRNALSPKDIKNFTFVPIPPSKTKENPLYDDRVLRMLGAIRSDVEMDIRELIIQTENTDAVHTQTERPLPKQILKSYQIDQSLVNQEPKIIALVDDVLTTGAHFQAAKSALSKTFPRKTVIGLFIARRVPDTNEI